MGRGAIAAALAGLAAAVGALALPSVASADGGFTNASFSFGTTSRPGDTVIVTFTVSGQPMYGAAVGLNGPFGGTVTSVSDAQNDCAPNNFQGSSEWPTYGSIWGALCTFFPVLQPGTTYQIKLVTSDTYGGSTILLNGVAVSGGQTSSPSPPPRQPPKDREKEKQKLLAKLDLIRALNDAQVPCAQSTLGAAAGTWGATVPGAGSIATTAAVIIGATAGVRCAALINRAYQDAQIVNDPPRAGLMRLARPGPLGRVASLPSCSRVPAAARAFCGELRPLASRYIVAIQRAASIDAAIRVTVDRESAAAKAGNAAAQRRQDAHGAVLEARLAAATALERRLGSQIARLIGSRHVTGELSAQQDAEGIAYIERTLERRGLSSTTLQQLAGSALKPHAVKILAVTR